MNRTCGMTIKYVQKGAGLSGKQTLLTGVVLEVRPSVVQLDEDQLCDIFVLRSNLLKFKKQFCLAGQKL